MRDTETTPEPAPVDAGPKLTPEQLAAVDQVLAWYRERPAEQTLTLGGYAGTGKTTLVKHILKVQPAVVLAPTGKAAQVLRRKGVPAATCHSWLYEPPDEDENGELVWTRLAKSAAFVIVDESSMIATEIYQDLLATGARILFVGDHGQLEPVGDNPQLMRDPAVRLETIMRQAADSPILSFAHEVRTGAPVVMSGHPDCLVTYPANRATDGAFLTSFDIVLTAFNRVRCSINHLIRKHKGYWEGSEGCALPKAGERLICLRNSKRYGLCNGQLGTVIRVGKRSDDALQIDFEPDGESVRTGIRIYVPQLGEEKTLPFSAIPKGLELFDWGYCITCHKSQGSEWDRVLVIEPPDAAVREMWSKARWRYTAITRAAKHLTFLSPNAVRAGQVQLSLAGAA